jgi:DNA/RNA-binding domain of Phe-tRNA-synthetase-like protein
MRYTVDPWVFERNPNVRFGIGIGRGISNEASTEEDSRRLEEAEQALRESLDTASLKEHPAISVYREALRNADINPNKYRNSIEGMSRRVLKKGSLPRINALVDSCNAIALKYLVSLGGHDLRDIEEDLMVRPSVEGDRFQPFGAEEFEYLEPGELVFTGGPTVQTRRWLWQQSELGKMDLETTEVFFQLVGFAGEHAWRLEKAMQELAELVQGRFGGSMETYMVDADNRSVEFA